MLFNSLLFLYLFLPVCLLLYFLSPRRIKNVVLLAASLVFYAWGGLGFVPVLAASILLNYLAGIAIGKAATNRGRTIAFITGIFLNILLLAAFKYTGFFVRNISFLTGLFGIKPWVIRQIVLPLGISFYTFKAISYLISVRRGEAEPQRNFINLALYLALFPQLIAGPIDRYRNLAGQIGGRKVTFALFASGVERFAMGLFKKVIISGPIAYAADKIFAIPADMLSMPMAWLGAGCYTLQVYYDFSGYSDMAIGLGRMFGFRFTENFDFPYISRSIREFWRRWHISLSTWLRDYLFLPVAYTMSRRMASDRYAGIRTDHILYLFSTLITFVICGFWHGPAWHFVAWGFLHGAAIVWERSRFGKWLDRSSGPFAHLYVLAFIVVTIVYFRSDTLTSALRYTKVMAGFGAAVVRWAEFKEYFTREFLLMAVIAILGSTRFFATIREKAELVAGKQGSTAGRILKAIWPAGSLTAVVLLLLTATMYLLSQTNTPFIYFRF